MSVLIETVIAKTRDRYAVCSDNESGFCKKPGITRENHPLNAEVVSSTIDKETGLEIPVFKCTATEAFKTLDRTQAEVNECRGCINFSKPC